MITTSTSPPINIDLGRNEPGMTLQREYRDGRHLVWRDYKVNGKVVKTPVDYLSIFLGKLTTRDWTQQSHFI
jgi:hypothetical protein